MRIAAHPPRRSGHGIVVEPAVIDSSQPHSDFPDVVVPAFVKNLIDTRKGPVDPFGDRFTTKPKASSPSLRAVVRKAQKVECLRLAHPALAAAHHREPAKLHEAGLVLVEAETETGQPFPDQTDDPPAANSVFKERDQPIPWDRIEVRP